MRSLATVVYEKNNIGDLLFRMVILNCENIAISPEWWDALSKEHREQISSSTFGMTNEFSPIKPDYLKHDLEGIAQWSFDNVISNMEN